MQITVKRDGSNIDGVVATIDQSVKDTAYSGSVDLVGTDETGQRATVTIQFTDESGQ